MTQTFLWLDQQTVNWTVAEFTDAAKWARATGAYGVLVKVFDGMQGEWYGGIEKFAEIFTAIHAQDCGCVPFGFHYGNGLGSSLSGECDRAIAYGQRFGSYCADMEGAWDGQGAWAQEFAQRLAVGKHQKWFKLWVSTWADIKEHAWLTAVTHIDAVADAWLPQDYDQFLYNAAMKEYPNGLHAAIEPTVDLSLSEYGQTNHPDFYLSDYLTHHNPEHVSLWSYTWAQKNPKIFQGCCYAVKQHNDKIKPMPVPPVTPPTPVPVAVPMRSLKLSPSGCVLDLPQSFQLENAHWSQDLCGPWTASMLHYAALPGRGNHNGVGSASPVAEWANQEYTKYIGPNVPSDHNGSSIDNMHSFFKDAGNLHFWDIASISPGSKHADDIATVKRVLEAGYPLAVTVDESSLISKRLGRNPYPWRPAHGWANHVIPIIGIDAQGDIIAGDELNAYEPWPAHYKASNIEIHWASIIQVVGPRADTPWLAPIPNNNPSSWPKGWIAQRF